MDVDNLNGRALYIPHADPIADASALTDAIVRSNADIFNHQERLVYLAAGTPAPVQVNKNLLLEITQKHVACKRLVQRGESWEVEYHPPTPDDRILTAVLTGRIPGRFVPGSEAPSLPGGSLLQRVPRV
jgi:hypothetical protein